MCRLACRCASAAVLVLLCRLVQQLAQLCSVGDLQPHFSGRLLESESRVPYSIATGRLAMKTDPQSRMHACPRMHMVACMRALDFGPRGVNRIADTVTHWVAEHRT
jgi:hypothetical protein